MKHTPIKKGMVLAAGLGTRLLPITQELPKPLVPVLNIPNILHGLHLLKRAGITEIILNLFHLPQQLETYLGNGSQWGMRLSYSHETKLLGTGGGVKKAEPFFEGEPFVLINCDFISDVDLSPIIARHCERRALGTMVLYQNPDLQPLYSKVGVDSKSHLCSLPRLQTRSPANTGIFTGIHVLAPQTLAYLQEIPCGINEVLYPALMKEKPSSIYGDFMHGYWHDTGDLPALFSASMRLLELLHRGSPVLRDFMEAFGQYEEKSPGIWAPKGAALPSGIELVAPVVLGQGCTIGKRAKLGPFVVIGDEAEINEGVSLQRFIAMGKPRIPASAEGSVYFHHAALSLKLPARGAE